MVFHQKQNTFGTNHFSCYIYENKVWENHFHKDFEVIYVLSGNLNCRIGEKCEILSQGEFAMCLPYEIHTYIPDKTSKYIVWGFSDSYVRTFASIVKGKSSNNFKFTCRDEIKSFILDVSKENADLPICTLKSVLYALCGEYLKCADLKDMDKKASRVYDIILFMENNYQHSCSLSDAAAHLGYDYHYISRYFKEHFGMNFQMLLTTYRLQNAVKLLEESDKTITDIAFESGFQSVRAFNQSFKKHTGNSPSQYRKSLNKI